MQQEAVRYARSLPLSLSGSFAFDTKNPGGIALDQLAFKVDDIPAVFDGNVTVAADSIVSDMTCQSVAIQTGVRPDSGRVDACRTACRNRPDG